MRKMQQRHRSSLPFRARLALLLSIVLTSAPLHAEPQDVRGPVALRWSKTSDLQVLPTVRASRSLDPQTAARVNAALRAEDGRIIDLASQCRADAPRPGVGDVGRRVTLTMAGPVYLSLVLTDSSYCGGPYPNDGLRSSFVFDLAMGRPVDWLALFPRGARGKEGSSLSGARLGLVVWPELTRRVRALAGEECGIVYDPWDRVGFAIYLDARTAELVAIPSGLPHAVQACAEEVRLSAPQLRRLGFKPRLIDALTTARNLQAGGSRR